MFSYLIFLSIQTGRTRKCSIVQEEDDDEDDEAERDDSSLNRRGSKSEGRINITVQDRLAETERLKKECAAITVVTAIAPTRSVFDGICNVKVLTASDMDPNRLGRTRQFGQKPIPRPITLQNNANDAVFQSMVEPPSPNPNMNKENEPQNGERSNLVENEAAENADCCDTDVVETKFLTDSSTISIPISTQTSAALVNPPKYKTMPSPTRANTILPGAMCLNEIFEEGTDVGSSDTSTTTTPRPIKHANFTNNRSSSQSGAHAHRRSKFNKSRTASCSSSDDDDSENRKKRAHKIVDSTKPFQTQRRDSNDDSSDSQDPGNPACGASGSGSGSTAFTTQIITNNSTASEPTNDSTQTSENTTNGRQQKNIQGFRRHRAGRRRTGETRLRESQSLNRITEVQESEIPTLNATQHFNRSPATLSTGAIDQEDPHSPTTSTHSTVTPNATHKPPKLGFGARLLQGFKRSDPHLTAQKTNEPKNKFNNNNNNKNNWNGHDNSHHISSADSNETLNWIKHSKPPLRVKAHQRLKNLKCLVDIFS